MIHLIVIPFPLKTQLSIISGFVLLNLAIGRLFHESLNLVCFSELIAVGISSFIFWGIVAKQLKKRLHKKPITASNTDWFTHGSIGVLTTLANVLISQGLIIFLMVYVYQCTSPSFSFVNASLTNNVAINLLCYFALLYSFFERHQDKIDDVSAHTKQPIASHLILSSGSKQHLVEIDDIHFIEASNNCIVLNTSKGQFVKYQSLKSFLEDHAATNFKRVHRSYAVNTDQIDFIKKNKNGDGVVTLKNKDTVKLSRNYKLNASG